MVSTDTIDKPEERSHARQVDAYCGHSIANYRCDKGDLVLVSWMSLLASGRVLENTLKLALTDADDSVSSCAAIGMWYMSATLGEGGDLERLIGRKNITRLHLPAGWERQSIGRRLFFFPGRSLDKEASENLTLEMMKVAGRSMVIGFERYAESINHFINDHGYRLLHVGQETGHDAGRQTLAKNGSLVRLGILKKM